MGLELPARVDGGGYRRVAPALHQKLGFPSILWGAVTGRVPSGGIVNAIANGVSNAGSESVNSRVQALKRRANGYRSRARFRDAIMFHLGGLALYPAIAVPLKSQ